MKDKKGFLPLLAALPIGTAIVGAILIFLIFGGILIFAQINKFFLAGLTIIVMTFIFAIKPAIEKRFNKSVVALLVFLGLLGVIVMLIPSLGLFQQEALEPGAYIEAPFFGTVKCDRDVGGIVNTGNIAVDKLSYTTVKCPDNTEECTVGVSLKGGTFPNTNRRVNYQKCDIYGICGNVLYYPTSQGISFASRSQQWEDEIISIKLSNKESIKIKFEAQGFGWGSLPNDETGYVKLFYQPYVLVVENSLEGGLKKLSGSIDCKIPLSSELYLSKIISSTVKDVVGKTADVTYINKNQLLPNEFYNFIAGTVTRATFGNTIDYKGETAYCAENIQGIDKAVIYKIGKITTPSATYNVVDVNTELGREDCCSEGRIQLNRVCKNFKWEAITIDPNTGITNVQCSLTSPCNPGKLIYNDDTKQSFNYACESSQCVVKNIATEECTQPYHCGVSESCINFKCQKITTVNIGTASGTGNLTDNGNGNITQCMWFESKIKSSSQNCGLLSIKKLWGGCTIVETEECKIKSSLVAIVLLSVLVISIIIIFISFIPKKKKKRY